MFCEAKEVLTVCHKNRNTWYFDCYNFYAVIKYFNILQFDITFADPEKLYIQHSTTQKATYSGLNKEVFNTSEAITVYFIVLRIVMLLPICEILLRDNHR